MERVPLTGLVGRSWRQLLLSLLAGAVTPEYHLHLVWGEQAESRKDREVNQSASLLILAYQQVHQEPVS